MAWQDRIREAAYTSPSGIRRKLPGYEDVSRSIEKKTSAFEFPDADGTYVQDLGHTGRRYPMRIFFWGADYDKSAEDFETGLLEVGAGRLEHPIYGVVDVVPFGEIKRRDDLKTAANQAVLEVTFWETIGVAYPSAQDDPASAVQGALDGYNTAAASQFGGATSLDSAVQSATFKGTFQSFLAAAKSGLQAIADVQDDVQSQFDAIYSSIDQGIDILVAQPLTLAAQTVQLIQAPGRAAAAISARLDAYGNLAASITGANSPQTVNDFYAGELYANSYVSGSVVSAINNQFTTKSEALAAAETILEQFDAVAAWRDTNYAALGEIDTGDAYQGLQKAVSLAAGFLVEISFSLKQERRVVLDRARTIIDLVAELYGSVDDQLDFFINSNSLTGSEILELPAGREIVYYV